MKHSGKQGAPSDPYRLLFENVGHMVCTLDLAGRFTAVNGAGTTLSGYSEQELIGRPAVELIAPELQAEAVKRFERRLVAGTDAPPDESILVTRDSRRVPVEITSTLFTDTRGRPLGVLGLVRDVSDRKRDEEILLESEERFRSAFDYAAIGMALVAPDGGFLQVNRALCELVGYSRDELLDAIFQDITHPDDLEADLGYVRRMLAGEIDTYQMEKRYFHKLGHVVWVLLSVSLVRASDGSPLYFISQIQDITERTHAHEALERSKAQLAEAQQIAQLASWERDASGAISWSNEVYDIYGLDPSFDPLSEERLIELVHPEDGERVLAALERARESRQPLSIEYRIVRPDGGIRWIQSRGKTVVGEDGRVGRRVTAQDITERKHAEAERDRLREDLHHAQKLEAIGRLAGGVAHDFNNMLTAIKGYSELLLGSLDRDDPLRAHAAQIKRAAEQAASLPRQLLAFGRKQTLQPELIDLSEIVTNTSDLLRRLISEAISLETRTAERIVACVDASQLEQVLINLALNARDAMPAGGTLTIATGSVEVGEELAAEHEAEVGRYSVISVSDTGHGIDPETRGKIFEPFFTTKATGQGSGLGLASVYGTVSQSGGFIRVESEAGKGARFEIYFPAQESADVRRAGPARSRRTAGPAVLLAEDEEIVRDLAVSVLERAGFEVRTAANGRDAAVLYEREADRIDVVVTDMVMPEMGGLALAERVLERRPDTPIVYMSGYTDEEPRAGDSTYLQKPFSAESLVKAVKEATATRTGITCVIADDHPAVLDAISHFLETQGVEVVARASTGEQALQAIEDHTPSIALLDVTMQPLHGIEVARQARRLSPATRSIIYTGHRDADLLAQALDAGVCGFLLKDAPLTELARALTIVAGGGTYVDAEVSGLAAAGRPAADISPLTRREREILGHLAGGKTNDKVAHELGISAETVQSHVRNAMGKLDAGTRTEAVATALRRSLIA